MRHVIYRFSSLKRDKRTIRYALPCLPISTESGEPEDCSTLRIKYDRLCYLAGHWAVVWHSNVVLVLVTYADIELKVTGFYFGRVPIKQKRKQVLSEANSYRPQMSASFFANEILIRRHLVALKSRLHDGASKKETHLLSDICSQRSLDERIEGNRFKELPSIAQRDHVQKFVFIEQKKINMTHDVWDNSNIRH